MPHLPSDLVFPLAVYMTALTAMVWRAAARIGKKEGGERCGFLGALLFFFSDIVLAFNLFVAPIPAADLYVMCMYYLGQCFIALKAVKCDKTKKLQ
jgi:uncharacterized membrane protein YhhN